MRSCEGQRKQKTPVGACPREEAVNPPGTAGGPSPSPAQNGTSLRGSQSNGLMEQVVARENMLAALKRVKENKGAPGIDGVTVDQLEDLIRARWPQIKEQLLAGTYKPQPIRRVEIPKPDGGVRVLGIPTVMDRLLQQALLQVLTPIFDPAFSEASYGFRPGKRGHDAVRRVRRYVEEGYEWVVDLDIEKFFDRVNHDILMAVLPPAWPWTLSGSGPAAGVQPAADTKLPVNWWERSTGLAAPQLRHRGKLLAAPSAALGQEG